MRLQIFQNEKLIDGEDLYHLEKDSFRIFLEQTPATEKKILDVYATASDSPGMNDHLIKHGIGECWMYSCNIHSMARHHPFDLLLLRYDQARSLETPEAIAAHSAYVSREAPRVMADLVGKFPHVSMGLDVGMNWFPGGEMYGGFHCSVTAIEGTPVSEYKGEYLYLSLFLLMQKFTIPGTDESLTLDLVKAHPFTLRFKSGDPIRATR
jgi:hypothetical protein